MKEWSTLKKLIWLRKINGGGGGDPLNTFTGAIVRFLAKRAKPIVKLEANFTPIQDLNGYDSPWPPGGGKNLLNNTAKTTTSNGVTFTVNADGTVSTQGTATGGTAVLKIWQDFNQNADLVLSGCPSGGDYLNGYSVIVADNVGSPVGDCIDIGEGHTLSSDYVSSIKQIQIIVRNGTNVSGKVFKPMLCLATAPNPTTFAPYRNICPISGHTGCDIFDKAEYDAQATPTVSISFGQTVYGGTLTVNEDGSGQVVADSELEVFNTVEDNRLKSQLNFFNTSVTGVGTIGDYTRIAFAVRPDVDQSKYNRSSNTYAYTMCNMAKHLFSYNNESTHWYRNTVLYVFLPTSLVGSTVQSVFDYLMSIKDTTPLSLWIPLATPITIPVTASQISTLVGNNVVWVNDATGDITVQAYGTEIT